MRLLNRNRFSFGVRWFCTLLNKSDYPLATVYMTFVAYNLRFTNLIVTKRRIIFKLFFYSIHDVNIIDVECNLFFRTVHFQLEYYFIWNSDVMFRRNCSIIALLSNYSSKHTANYNNMSLQVNPESGNERNWFNAVSFVARSSKWTPYNRTFISKLFAKISKLLPQFVKLWQVISDKRQ